MSVAFGEDWSDCRAERAKLLRGRVLLQFIEIDPELLDRVVRRMRGAEAPSCTTRSALCMEAGASSALQRLRHLAEHRPDVIRAIARIRELLLQHDKITHGDSGVRGEIVELPADIERLFGRTARKRTRSAAERTLHSRRSGK